jgi:YHS domain-containing protein
MVKDPQCGMYVAENLAIQAQVEGTPVYFCSKKCREDYVSELKNRRRPDQQPV